jgi:hypothetical protein
MKAILEFNLPDDDQEFRLATSGMRWWSAMTDIDNELRRKIKYVEEMSDDTREELEVLRTFIHETLAENKVSLDDVE